MSCRGALALVLLSGALATDAISQTTPAAPASIIEACTMPISILRISNRWRRFADRGTTTRAR